MARAFSHYFRDVRHLEGMDVYRVLQLFEVTDPALQHAIKKLLVPGSRGAKDRRKDLEEAVASIERALEMMGEDEAAAPPSAVISSDPAYAAWHGDAGYPPGVVDDTRVWAKLSNGYKLTGQARGLFWQRDPAGLIPHVTGYRLID